MGLRMETGAFWSRSRGKEPEDDIPLGETNGGDRDGRAVGSPGGRTDGERLRAKATGAKANSAVGCEKASSSTGGTCRAYRAAASHSRSQPADLRPAARRRGRGARQGR